MLVVRDGFDFADSRGWEEHDSDQKGEEHGGDQERDRYVCACIMCWILNLTLMYGVMTYSYEAEQLRVA